MGKKNWRKIPLTPSLQDKEPSQDVHIDCTGAWKNQHRNDFSGETIIFKLDLLTVRHMSWLDRIYNDEKQDSQACCYLVWYQLVMPISQTWKCSPQQWYEFIGLDFQEILNNYGITLVPTTVKNQQANSVIEQLHLTQRSTQMQHFWRYQSSWRYCQSLNFVSLSLR